MKKHFYCITIAVVGSVLAVLCLVFVVKYRLTQGPLTKSEQKGASEFADNSAIDPSGKYVATLRDDGTSHSLNDLVIQDLRTSDDVYVLKIRDVFKNNPHIEGYLLGTGQWVQRPDGVYLYTSIDGGARPSAFVQIRRDTWKTHIYEVPADFMSSAELAMPPFAPYMAYTNVTYRTMAADSMDDIFAMQLKEASQKKFILGDLMTGVTTTIETVPIIRGHNFKPVWLDDTTLEYTMPDGTKKTYVVTQ